MKGKRFIVCFSIVLLVLTSCTGDRYLTSISTEIPIYSEDNDSSMVIGTMYPRQDTLLLLSESWDGWMKVQYNDGEGYVNSDNTKFLDKNGEQVWFTKTLFKGLGMGAGVLLGIALAIGLVCLAIGLLYYAVVFIVGIVMRLLGYVVAAAIAGGLLGLLFCQGDMQLLFKFAGIGAVIGIVIGIIMILKNPVQEALAGADSAVDAYADYKKENTVILEGGIKAKRNHDGTITDENNQRWHDNGTGTFTKIE